MTRVEFGDFYKFLCSIGVILISLAFLIPWLFIREQFDIATMSADIVKLTSKAQDIINIRQSIIFWILQNLLWVSVSLAATGTIFLGAGIFFWARKQSKIDVKEMLETDKLRLELKQMTPSEVVDKATTEIQERDHIEPPPLPEKTKSSTVRNYMRVEEIVYKKLGQCFGEKNVLVNRRIGNVAYDAIALRAIPYSDVIIELKTYRGSIDRIRVNSTILYVKRAIESYKVETGRLAIGVILFIGVDDPPPTSGVNELLNKYQSDTPGQGYAVKLFAMLELVLKVAK